MILIVKRFPTIWPVLITGISAPPVRTIRLLVSGRRDDSYERSRDSKKAANFFDRTCQWNQRPSRSRPFQFALPRFLQIGSGRWSSESMHWRRIDLQFTLYICERSLCLNCKNFYDFNSLCLAANYNNLSIFI